MEQSMPQASALKPLSLIMQRFLYLNSSVSCTVAEYRQFATQSKNTFATYMITLHAL
jgi:hypothetical protein